MVKLANKYADQGLVTASISVDDESLGTVGDVLPFLKKKNATFKNFLYTGDDYYKDFKLEETEGPPVYYIYGKDGKQVAKLVGASPENKEKMETLIKEHLKK